MTMLSVEKLEKTYPDGTRAVRGIDLAVAEGEFIVLLGPSGCGKTTTLRMVAGLELPTGGRITLSQRDVTNLRPARRDVGMVFQFYALYPHLSVRENIAFPLRATGIPAPTARQKAEEIAERLGIAALLNRRPRQLSGGDQQRVSLARVMVRRPKLQLMDEPLGTLDADARQGLLQFIVDRQQKEAMTTLYVTHDQEEAMSLADRVVVMSEGRIRQLGTPEELYDRPADLFVARFVGSPGMNFAPGKVTSEGEIGRFQFRDSEQSLRVKAPAGKREMVLGVRAEFLRLSPAGALHGTVAWVEYLGSSRSLHVQGAFGRWVVRAPLGEEVRVGDTVRFDPDPEAVHLFDEATGRRV